MSHRSIQATRRAVVIGMALAAFGVPATAAAAPPSQAQIDQAARANGKSPAEIQEILADRTSRLDHTGRIFYVDPAREASASAPAVQAAPFPYANTFTLHSRPGSSRKIYLDFNGHTISGTAWNGSSWGTPASYWAEPFSLDASTAFSNAEMDIVQSVWQRVAEDYAPFDVDVTTQDPGFAAIDRSSSADTQFGTRALITDAPEVGSTCGCGGVAYLGVFDATVSHAYYQPALVFPKNLGNTAKNIAEATSHEVGHNFDLRHDGTSSAGYYTGHGSWAPIMGVGYYKPIVQWSRGQYSGANNTQDDLAIIPANGAALLADDVGNTIATAQDRGSGPSMSASGIITTDADTDVFKITAAAGSATFTASPAPVSPNLDIQLSLLSSSGAVLATSNPASGMVSSDVASGLSASISTSLPSSGTYYLSVTGVGAFDPLSTGYSGYASIGRYSMSGSFVAANNNMFASATALAGLSGATNGSTVGATKEAGEPIHGGNSGGKSIWFRYTAPKSGTLTIDTFGSSFDTLLGVYTGSAVNALTTRASNDDANGGLQSRVSLAVTAGTVYSIAVDGYNGASGSVTLHWSLP